MSKPYTIADEDVQHYKPPELSGHIVGMNNQSLRPQTVEEIEAIQKQAYEEARKEGYEKGYNEGLKQGLEKLTAQATQLQKIFNFIQQPLNEMDKAVEHQLASLAVVLATQLMKKENQLDVQHIQKLVHDSLEYLPVKSRDVCVRLHPDDIAALKQADIDVDAQSWKCAADPSVTAGGCLIESETSYIDASVEARVEQLTEQLYLNTVEPSDDDTRE